MLLIGKYVGNINEILSSFLIKQILGIYRNIGLKWQKSLMAVAFKDLPRQLFLDRENIPLKTSLVVLIISSF